MGFLRWDVGNGTQVDIDLDAIKGFTRNHSMSKDLIHFLHDWDIKYFTQINEEHNNLPFL